MAKQKTMKIVTIIEDDPILGVKYGEKEIALSQENVRQLHIAGYLSIKARNRHLLNKNRTTQK